MCSECVEHWDHGPPLKSPQTADMLNKCLRCDCLESEGFICVKLPCSFVFLTAVDQVFFRVFTKTQFAFLTRTRILRTRLNLEKRCIFTLRFLIIE